jgi:hypothetical protein
LVHALTSVVQAQLFLNKTIGELMFDGYEDELVTIGDALSEGIDVPMEKFGWFYKVYLNFSYVSSPK